MDNYVVYVNINIFNELHNILWAKCSPDPPLWRADRNGISFVKCENFIRNGGLACTTVLVTNFPWQWRHNERDSVPNHRRLDCLLRCLLRRWSKKTPKLRATGRCEGKPPVASGFHSQMASTTKNVLIWWRHHVQTVLCLGLFIKATRSTLA